MAIEGGVAECAASLIFDGAGQRTGLRGPQLADRLLQRVDGDNC